MMAEVRVRKIVRLHMSEAELMQLNSYLQLLRRETEKLPNGVPDGLNEICDKIGRVTDEVVNASGDQGQFVSVLEDEE